LQKYHYIKRGDTGKFVVAISKVLNEAIEMNVRGSNEQMTKPSAPFVEKLKAKNVIQVKKHRKQNIKV